MTVTKKQKEEKNKGSSSVFWLIIGCSAYVITGKFWFLLLGVLGMVFQD